ncbi:hypothetical protein VCRA2117O380_80116 [Vibrio crassostreae]|nr:hypothetical protein VCRA2119O382_80115 [Vibrio crassostreae]CAK2225847.1 hypothetical protein VCRA2117O380_80116 [Vibrio crassostreae]CAK2366077.1 hypothetical protein VCRA2116O141_70139 [Vibrio crassostreae]CAK2684631.1 hypothetical protein VCRA2119O149_170042 [Vibrio crassostreae]CAK2706874.1 hypothetical protein VCRA2120E331_140070 [Vibrio crassostreae]
MMFKTNDDIFIQEHLYNFLHVSIIQVSPIRFLPLNLALVHFF